MYTIMPQFLAKTSKVGLWMLLPLFLVSNSGLTYGPSTVSPVKDGSYFFKASGAYEGVLQGQIDFETDVKTLNDGMPVTRLEIRLGHAEEKAPHSMGFVITKRTTTAKDLVGQYKVNSTNAGFSNTLEGVFGFADLAILGEQPFFAHRGAINMTSVGNDILKGDLKLTLRNFEGRTINVSGSFIATKNE